MDPAPVSEQPPSEGTTHARERRFKGIAASPGIWRGKISVRTLSRIRKKRSLSPDEIETELQRFATAHNDCVAELEDVIRQAVGDKRVVRPILETQLLLLTDTTIVDHIQQRIRNGEPAENAVHAEYSAQSTLLKRVHDTMLRDRASDIDSIKHRLVSQLNSARLHGSIVDGEGTILVAPFVSPTEVVIFRDKGIKAFVTELSGIASHASIMSRQLNIPAVIGVKEVTKFMKDGATAIVDGFTGTIVVNPRPETLLKFERRISTLADSENKLGKLAKQPSQTSDKRKIGLLANVSNLEEIEQVTANRADGIGLIRTESFAMTRGAIPSEKEQVQYYREIAERAYPLPVNIRAFDFGSDKSIGMMLPEDNPALGMRGMRWLLKNKKVFRQQVRAVLRASKHKNIRFMLPFVTSLNEAHKAMEVIQQVKASLTRKGTAFDARTPIGIMIETPSAAMQAQSLAAMFDFISIGTNDLTQYTLAADRTNPLVAAAYDYFHPAVLQLISRVAEAGVMLDIPVGICGEMASHPATTQLLIGMGITELSVVPSQLLNTKKQIRKTSFRRARKLAVDIMQIPDAQQIRKKLIRK